MNNGQGRVTYVLVMFMQMFTVMTLFLLSQYSRHIYFDRNMTCYQCETKHNCERNFSRVVVVDIVHDSADNRLYVLDVTVSCYVTQR